MKTVVTILVLLFGLTPLHAFAQGYKFGKVSKEEIEMSTYDKDTEADAVVLNEKILVYYSINVNDFKLVTEVSRKIKILKEAGKEWGDVEFYYYETPHLKEYISGFNATSYNIENGKIVKASLDKKYMTTEKLSESRYRRKFSIPQVKAGTVIEYKYKITSDYIYNVPVLYFQSHIPIKSSYMEVSIPEYFRFNSNLKQHERLNLVRDVENITIPGTDISYANEVMKFSISDMPALKKEPYVWCINDHRAGIDYEITAIDMPMYKKNFSVDWADVNNAIKNSEFNSQFKTKNPYKAEVAEIIAKTEGNDRERITQILRLVQNKIKWDGTRRFLSENISKAVKDGAGSSADKNFVLAGALRDAGYNVSAVLMSTREQGRLPLTHASQDKIETFIIRVNLPNGSHVYLDGASIFSNYNVLPTNLLVDRARLYDPNGLGEWIDLTKLVKNNMSSYVKAKISSDGKLKGTCTNAYSNQFVYTFNANYDNCKDNSEYCEAVEKKYEVEIDSINVHNRMSLRSSEIISFSKDVIVADSMLYISSFPFPIMTDNPFKGGNRTMPVEFPYRSTYKFITEVEIPNGYKLVETPENSKITACNGALSLSYYTKDDGNGKISIIMDIQENEIYIHQDFIPNISGFFDLLTEFATSQIVYKRI